MPHHVGLWDPAVRKVHKDEPTMAVIRNPYDILVSWWIVRNPNRDTREPLEAFINSFNDSKGNFQREGKLLYHAKDAKFLVRFESMEANLASIWGRCGIEGLKLGKVNKTEKKYHWTRYYSKEAYKAANKRFGKEILEHGYKMLG